MREDRGHKRGEINLDRNGGLCIAGRWRETWRGGKESQTIDFSFFSSHLLLCVTQGGCCETRRPCAISFFFLIFHPWSLLSPLVLSFSSYLFPPLFLSTVQYQFLLALPDFYPRPSPVPAPPVSYSSSSLYIFLSDSSAGGLGQLKGGVVAIRQTPPHCCRVGGWRRKRRRM